ncbi:hypothetical protein M8Z33_36035 [Streptomyces sp. ZAF1911]|uniref:hypothetical protein n=1 Tax=Streptomyces TaxID=1883 RepID=UPI001FAF779F|nr:MULTISPECIES: hypothetical protein [unclassified Streptomyces]MCJ0872826.1 hypothetical protein [Streptomyces sp. AP-93]MCM1968654.1 hypothetical protein [Streptomyces sp. G1]MCP3756725.1 hypothetical protein [Streptomyces sp. TBY4]MCX4777564.1 hypothetical protein [Streptomyces sp. NBC_01264]MCX5125007.1 hypothetical protein [Streptomyces sp. NBC_00347]
MHQTLQPAGPARPSAAEANEAIRQLVESRVDGEWPSEAYEFLLEEWAAASRAEAQ